MKTFFFSLLASVFTLGCANGTATNQQVSTNNKNLNNEMKEQNYSNTTDIYFAGGNLIFCLSDANLQTLISL